MPPSNNSQQEPTVETKQKFLTYFLLFFPTIVIIAIPGMVNESLILALALKFLLAFYQFVALKTFIDKHYEYD